MARLPPRTVDALLAGADREGCIAVLAELLDHIASHDQIWYATHREVADCATTAAAPAR